jgi:RHS repeat-associated protein
MCATSYQKHSARSVTQNLQALQDAIPADPKVVGSVAIPATPYVASILWYTDYDSRDRLTAFYRKGANHRLSYDANSNRLSSLNRVESDTDLAGNFDQSNTTSTSYLQANSQAPKWEATSNRLLGYNQKLMLENPPGTPQSTTYANVAYTLDAAGNLTSDGLRQYSYDLANRLSSVQIGQSNGGGNEASKITYLHNSAGQRVFKSEPQVAQLAPNTSTLGSGFITWLQANFGWLFAQAQVDATLGQSYVYADGSLGSYNLLGEYGNGGSQSQGRTEYLWLPAPTGQGQPAQLIGIYQNNRFYATHTDHLGTPRRMTDDAAQVVWQWSYSAFGDNPPSGVLKSSPKTGGATGNVLKATTPLITMNLRMSGQYFDGESGQFYNYFRNYQPQQGRYTQNDPIGLNGGMNRFGYVSGNPLSRVDASGLADSASPWEVGWEWLTGTGPRHHDFYDGDPFAELLRNHRHIRNLIKDVCDGNRPSAGDANYYVGGLDGVPLYLHDYSNLATGGNTGNLAVTYLGSYRLQYTYSGSSINMVITNSSTMSSATHPPVIGYTPWWNRNIGDPLNKYFSSGPLSKTTQRFELNESLAGCTCKR